MKMLQMAHRISMNTRFNIFMKLKIVALGPTLLAVWNCRCQPRGEMANRSLLHMHRYMKDKCNYFCGLSKPKSAFP